MLFKRDLQNLILRRDNGNGKKMTLYNDWHILQNTIRDLSYEIFKE